MLRIWLIAAAVVAATQPTPAQAFKRLQVGQELAAHTLMTPSGEARALQDTFGPGATAIVFWASWSPRSRDALEGIQELNKAHRNRGLAVVAVNVDGPGHGPEVAEAIDATQKQLRMGVNQLVDADLALYDSCGVVAVPSLVLLDGTGKVASLISGYSSSAQSRFAGRTRQVLGLAGSDRTTAESALDDQSRSLAQGHYRMAKFYLRKHRTEQALEFLAKALAEDPRNTEVRSALAGTLRSVGRLDEAARLELSSVESEEYCLVPRRGPAATQWQ